MNSLYRFVIAITLLSNSANSADVDPKGLLAAAKFTGLCGAINQMIDFQQKTQMAGGDEFVIRFVNTELARLGKTREQFGEQCKSAFQVYDAMMNTGE